MKKLRLMCRVSVVWCLVLGLFHGEQAQAAGGAASGSGTYRGRVLTEQFLHVQALLGKSRTLALSPGPVAAARPDVDGIAVVDSTGGVVIEPNFFDLMTRSVEFSPSAEGYTAGIAALTINETARRDGTPVLLGDDDAKAVSLPFLFPFYGESHSEIFIHSDGNLTFQQPDAASTSRSFARAVGGPPRIAPLFNDLDPSIAGSVITVYAISDRFIVTWDEVPEYSASNNGAKQTFQAVLHADGRIEYHYLTISAASSVVGIMPGELRGGATAADLSQGVSEQAAGALAEVFSALRDVDLFTAAQKFYQDHDDVYDFLVVFNAFDLQPPGSAFAFEINVRNQVRGIGNVLPGLSLFDFGPELGSARRLQSFISMGALSQYPEDPAVRIPIVGENTTLSVLGQEAGHRFGVFVDFFDAELGRASSALLGRQQAHWSFFFNSDASVLEGNRIADHGMTSPRFETVATVEKYSALDQYLMGLRRPDEVAPSFLVEDRRNSPQGLRSPGSLPASGVQFDGDRKEILVESIIAAEGERRPAAEVAQKRFRFAFLLLVDGDDEPSPAAIAKLVRLRDEWVDFFHDGTDQRAVAEVELTRMLHLSSWPAAGLVLGTPGMATLEIAAPRAAGLDVMLSADNGGVSVPGVVTIPAGAVSVPFPIEGVSAGVTRLRAVAAKPGFDEPEAFVEVKPDVSGLQLEVVSGDTQTGGFGVELAQLVVIRLADGNLLPFSGMALEVSVSRDGAVVPGSAVTDEHGEMRLRWTLATNGALNTMRVRLAAAPEIDGIVFALAAGPPPEFGSEGVIGAAGFNLGPSAANTGISPGGLVSIFGTGLATSDGGATSFPLPITLGTTQVTINGFAAPLLFVSGLQLNLQVPSNLTGDMAELVVETAAGTSESVEVPLAAVQPGIFFDVATGIGVIVNLDDGSVVWDRAAAAGSQVVIYSTGLGAVNPAVASGLPASADPVSRTVSAVGVGVGGLPAAVSFSGLAPGFAGVYQINATLPEGLVPGRYVLTISVNGLTSNEVLIDIQ